ncbi:MAG: GNAT family N-acetyltransferase [Bacteroidota bacterium]
MEIRSPQTKEEWNRYYQLRWEVLRKPWNQPWGSEKSSEEDLFFHIAAFVSNQVIGVGCLKMNNDYEGQIRFMAVDLTVQRKGVGVSIMKALEENAKEKGVNTLVLHARELAIPFYKHCGYTLIEKSYLLFDSIQHYLMSKQC